MAEFALEPRSIFDAVGGCCVEASGVSFDEAAPRELRSLSARRGQTTALSAAIEKATGTTLPEAGKIAASKGFTIIYTGPDQWLVSAESDAHLAKMTTAAAGLASITDQSDGMTALTLSGPRSTDVLMRLCSLDLDDNAFPTGAAARTSMQQINVIIVRTGDGPDYLLNTPRSTARDFAHDMKVAIAAVMARGGLNAS